jgi:hypothetical protein
MAARENKKNVTFQAHATGLPWLQPNLDKSWMAQLKNGGGIVAGPVPIEQFAFKSSASSAFQRAPVRPGEYWPQLTYLPPGNAVAERRADGSLYADHIRTHCARGVAPDTGIRRGTRRRRILILIDCLRRRTITANNTKEPLIYRAAFL